MADRQSSLYDLVIICVAEDGLDAATMLLSAIPREFPAPIVVAATTPHLDVAALQRRSALPIQRVDARSELEAGTVLVVDAERPIQVTERSISLDGDQTRGRAGLDQFLDVAVDHFGERLIAVLLAGVDGAAGAREVKRRGGIVVAQAPAATNYFPFPRALPPTTADSITGLEQLAPLLRNLVTGATAPARPDRARDLRAFLEDLRDQSGIDFCSYNRQEILRRLQRRMVATDNEKLDDYVRYLDRHPEESQRLISTFLCNASGFIHDPDLFAYLRETALPDLIAQARRRGDQLRLWSAACATGEDAYSLAILVIELLGEEIDRLTVRIFATDLDADAIAFARHGMYPASALAGLAPELVARYFN
jgi:two-component system CheB/CheR fusion protein